MPSTRLYRRLLLFSPVWLVIAAGRVLRLSFADKELHVDEVWSIWQLLGTNHTYTLDANWPPLYVVLLDVWQTLVGRHPLFLRYLSVLLFLIGASAVYQILCRMRDQVAGILGMLAYSALPIGIFLTTEVRGYALAYSLFPVTLWLSMLYFDRPSLRRAALVGIAMAALCYTTYSAAGALLVLGLYWLIVYHRKFRHWWAPAIIAGGIILPLLLLIRDNALGRVQGLMEHTTLPPIFSSIADIYQAYAGEQAVFWLVIVVVAGAFLLWKRSRNRQMWALLGWVLFPVILYATEPVLGLFRPTYSWFVLLGGALVVGWGLSYLPRIGQILAASGLVLAMFQPVPYDNYQAQGAPLGRSLEWLAVHAQWGDVVYIDPNWQDGYCSFEGCINAEVWEYLIDVFFPHGLPIVDDPAGYRRVWYLKADGWQDSQAEQRVVEGRVPGQFVGPWHTLLRLYEAPPDPVGIPYANGMRFHGMDVLDQTPRPLVRREGDTMRLRLWWSVDRPVEVDYSVSVQVVRGESVIAQVDGAPVPIDGGSSQTSAWEPGRFYIEERVLSLPEFAFADVYTLYLAVYQWWDGMRIDAPGTNDAMLLPLHKLTIKSWN